MRGPQGEQGQFFMGRGSSHGEEEGSQASPQKPQGQVTEVELRRAGPRRCRAGGAASPPRLPRENGDSCVVIANKQLAPGRLLHASSSPTRSAARNSDSSTAE